MASPGKKSFLLRVDPALWSEMERLASQELRSVNAQVEYLLREALARRGRRGGATTPEATGPSDPSDPSSRSGPGAPAPGDRAR